MFQRVRADQAAANAAAVSRRSAELRVRVPPRWLHQMADREVALGGSVVTSTVWRPISHRPLFRGLDFQFSRRAPRLRRRAAHPPSGGADGCLSPPTIAEIGGREYGYSADKGVDEPLRRAAPHSVTVPAHFQQRQRAVSVVPGAVQ